MPHLSFMLAVVMLVLPSAQETAGLPSAVARLGSFDFDTRTTAARQLRRAPLGEVVPLLEAAARNHADEYVRFRALVLLSGLDQAVTTRVATSLIADRNDRVRTVVYQWFERHPRPEFVPRFIEALEAEASPFVRPALARTLAAHGDVPAAQQVLRPLVLRGEDAFRGSVIVALGDYRRIFALDEVTAVAQLDGPLQDDAATALGRIGAPASRPVVAGLQKTVPRELQPTVSAALCLLQVDCAARVRFVVETMQFAAASEQQMPLLRGAVHAAGVLAVAGHREAFDAMVDTALAASGAAREAITLGIGNVILRQPLFALEVFEARAQARGVGELFRDGFDMLSEDFEEEQFGAELRRALWAAPEGAVRRQAAASLLDALEF